MDIVKTIAPVIDLNNLYKDMFMQAGTDVTLRAWASTSYSNSAATFSCPPPSMNTFISRLVYVLVPFVVTYAGTTSGSALLEAGKDALRCVPIASNVVSSQLTINNQTFVMQNKDIVPYLMHYIKKNIMATYPDMTDKYQVYVDGATAINNPLGQYFNQVGDMRPRGGFPCVIVNGATASTITATVIEPVWIPPCCIDGMETGFSNVRTFDYNMQFSSSLSRLVCHATSSATLSGVTASISQPSLIFAYTTPPIGYVPRDLTYESLQIQRFVTPLGSAVTADATSSILSSNMQLNCIPSHVFLFIREQDSSLTYASSDTVASITGVNINFNNKSGILSSANQAQLFQICRENGLQDTWDEFYGVTANLATKVGLTGSVIKLVFGKDISIGDDHVGKVGAYNLQVTANFRNINQSASLANPTLYVIAVTPQKLIFHSDGVIEATLGLTPEMAEMAKGDVPYIAYHHLDGMFGGSIGGSFWSKIKSGVNWLKDKKIVSTVASALNSIGIPFAGPVASLAKEFEERKEERKKEGGTIVGGKPLSRAELLRLARRV